MKKLVTINNIIEVLNFLEGLKAVIFDLDDTLYSEKEYVKSGYHRVASEVLTMIPKAEEKLWTAFERKQNAFDVILREEGLYSDYMKAACLQAYRYQKPNIHLYDGVEEMLRTLRKLGLFLGIITDGHPERQHAKIRALGIEESFDYIIVTDELGGLEYRKPCSRAYELMQEKFKIEYAYMVYIGDNIKKDFLAPQNLGMRSIYYRNADGLYL